MHKLYDSILDLVGNTLGTIAGDDTLLLICTDDEAAQRITTHITPS